MFEMGKLYHSYKNEEDQVSRIKFLFQDISSIMNE